MEIIKNDSQMPEAIIASSGTGVSSTPTAILKKRIKPSSILIFLLATITIIAFLSYLVGFWPEVKMKNPSLPTATPIINKPLNLVPSSLATDAGFLKLENDLKTLQNDNNSVDLSEPKISFPNLEMNVSFEK